MQNKQTNKQNLERSKVDILKGRLCFPQAALEVSAQIGL